MVATYNEVQDFVREARKLALRDGGPKCGKQARLLELRGDMPLTRLARDEILTVWTREVSHPVLFHLQQLLPGTVRSRIKAED